MFLWVHIYYLSVLNPQNQSMFMVIRSKTSFFFLFGLTLSSSFWCLIDHPIRWALNISSRSLGFVSSHSYLAWLCFGMPLIAHSKADYYGSRSVTTAWPSLINIQTITKYGSMKFYFNKSCVFSYCNVSRDSSVL